MIYFVTNHTYEINKLVMLFEYLKFIVIGWLSHYSQCDYDRTLTSIKITRNLLFNKEILTFLFNMYRYMRKV